jgi:hypothetical protein
MMEIEKTLPKKVQQTLAKTRKLAEKQAKELREAEQNELRKVADEFLIAVKEEVDSAVLLVDFNRLDRLVTQVDIVMGYNLIKTIRDKGFSKELTELCDKVGRGEH